MAEEFYKKANITIDEDLTIHPVDGFDGFSQNSIGTQVISAKLNGWALEDGAGLFLAFEKVADGYKYSINPIIMATNFENNTYWLKVPPEVMKVSGEWLMCVYKKFNFNAETGTADYSMVGVPFSFTVKNTIADNGGGDITLSDIIGAIESYKSAKAELEKIAAGQGSESGSGSGGTAANVKRIEFNRPFWEGETNPTFGALFWATEVIDGDITVIGITGGTAYDAQSYYPNVANVYLTQEGYDVFYNETQPENGLFEYGNNFAFPIFDIMNIKTVDENDSLSDELFNYSYSQVEVPSATEIYSSTSKNIKAAFAFSDAYSSPGMIYDAQITVKEFTYIRIVLELIATDTYAATILTDGTIEEVDYNE